MRLIRMPCRIAENFDRYKFLNFADESASAKLKSAKN